MKTGGKINIMYMIDHLHGASGGGTERHLENLVGSLDRERFNTCILGFDVMDTPLVMRMKNAGQRIIHFPVGRYYTLPALKKAFALSRIIRENRIDIVQTFHFKSDFYGALVARLSGVKHIVSSKRDTGHYKKKVHFLMNSMTHGIFSRYIVVADAVGDVVSNKERVPREKIFRIYNGVDIERFRPAPAGLKEQRKKELGFGSEDFIIGMVAVFRPEKHHHILFEAASRIQSDIKGLKVVLVGGGPLMDHYKAMCAEKGLSGKAVFTGPVQDVERYISIFDAACLVPGKNEGFSNAILENMAMGLPVIATDVGGNAEAVLNGYNGYVIEPDNAQALAGAIHSLYKDKELREEMGKNSRRRVEELFTLDGMVRSHEEFYESLVRGH